MPETNHASLLMERISRGRRRCARLRGNAFIDVDNFDSFSNASIADPVKEAEFRMTASARRARHPYRHSARLLSLEGDGALFEQVFHNVSNGERILVAAMMFRNEPYQ